MNKLIDLSHVIEDDMPVYPGDSSPHLFQSKYLDVDKYNDHRLEIGMHAGTHIDSPMHLTESKEYISEASVESFIGVGHVLDVRNESVITMKAEYEKLIKDNSIVLLYTGLGKIYGSTKYYYEHPIVDVDFCRFLLKKKVKMLGMDMPSPDKYPYEAHKFLLDNKIYIIENLNNLDKLLDIEKFEVIALPLKIKANSSMTRVVARVQEEFI